MTSYDVDDRKEDVKPIDDDRKDGNVSALLKKVKRDDDWVWHPHRRAQSLEHLLAKDGVTVSGQLQCRRCKEYQNVEFDLAAAFGELRDGLVAHREQIRGPEFGFGAHGEEIQAAEFASTSCAKSVCPNCGKRSMSPVMPQFEPFMETKTQYNMRKVDNMNMLFLLLGKFMRFCTADELHATWLYLGPPTPIPSALLPHGMPPKQAYLIALHYRLARILDPDCPILDIGSWPFLTIFG